MNETNKRLLVGAGLAVIMILLSLQAITWIDDSVTQWETKAKAQETIRNNVAVMAEQLKASRSTGKNQPLKSGTEAIDSLLPWLEKETGSFQLTDKMQQIAPISLKPNETSQFREKADLNLKAITMETALKFLDRLESTAQIRILRGDIKRAEKEAVGITLSLEIGLL